MSTALPLRVGIGYDSHRFGEGGPMRLGGIDIPADMHCAGHSDGDAICHAVTDALLGAAALGDIGEMFPDTDATNKGKDSTVMLSAAVARLHQAGWRVGNVDRPRGRAGGHGHRDRPTTPLIRRASLAPPVHRMGA